MHEKIQKEHTGTPCYLASQLNISRSTLYEMLSYLKDLGAKIVYSHLKESFYYKEDFSIHINISIKVVNGQEIKDIL